MANLFKEMTRIRRSVIGKVGGESFADVTDPYGANVAKQDERVADAAALEEAKAAAAAEALAAAEQTRLRTLIDPEPMPTQSTARTARRRATARNLARRGRASTILTSADDALGGEA